MKQRLSTREKTLRMVQVALLMALEVVLTLLYIPTPISTINLNFGLIPIVIAAVFLGPLAGTLIGCVSGTVTAIQVLTVPSFFNTFLVSVNPVAACVISVLKTALAGFIIGLVYKAVSKGGKHSLLDYILASALCPIVNSGVFALGMFAFFGNALLADPTLSTFGTGLVAIVFIGLIGVNFVVEFIVTTLLSPAVCKTLTAAKIFSK